HSRSGGGPDGACQGEGPFPPRCRRPQTAASGIRFAGGGTAREMALRRDGRRQGRRQIVHAVLAAGRVASAHRPDHRLLRATLDLAEGTRIEHQVRIGDQQLILSGYGDGRVVLGRCPWLVPRIAPTRRNIPAGWNTATRRNAATGRNISSRWNAATRRN